MGVSSLKVKGITPVSFEELLPNFQELMQQTNAGSIIRPNP